MLVNPHSESQDEPHEHEPQQQKYETMQCFAVSEPKSIKEEGDGKEGEVEEDEEEGEMVWVKKVEGEVESGAHSDPASIRGIFMYVYNLSHYKYSLN